MDPYCEKRVTLPKIPEGFKLECVVVCSKYSDFLRHTLPHNKFLFDKIVVVTDYEDAETRRMCEFHHVQCIPTDVLNTRKGQFRKGAGINAGLQELSRDGWVLHLDADIWLPPQTRILLRNADLDPARIYGCDRFLVRGPRSWEKFLERPRLQHENECYVHMSAFPLGTRVAQNFQGGYIPVGFFQLWHPIASGVHAYPEGHTDAGREDGNFAAQWPRSRRELLAEIVGYHLESDDARNAANWGGRTTAPFTVLGED